MLLFFLILVFLGTLLLFYRAYKNTHKVALNRVKLSTIHPNHSQGPQLNILQISDMHLEKISISPEQLYKKLVGEKIDLIALTGDYLDKRRSIPRLIPYLKVLNRLNPRYGMYAVFGNHDYKLKQTDFKSLRSLMEDHGCITLQNENKTIFVEGKPLHIIGIDDFHTKRSDLLSSYAGLNEGYHLVLTHDPNIVLKMGNWSFDYLLSGHFHGGQIYWPKPYHLAKLGRSMMKMDMIKGLHYYEDKPFYISEGLGQTSVNIRVGSRPEITLHQLSINSIKQVEDQKAV
ncbi:metallophosphoesterase [Neobacillus sp. NPDC093182]|uniref:metallophosphoesterase n=1 Tax=Neobacillus sp. NPDC093182 TaxID=3364297 RepID=UPI00380FC8CE